MTETRKTAAEFLHCGDKIVFGMTNVTRTIKRIYEDEDRRIIIEVCGATIRALPYDEFRVVA